MRYPNRPLALAWLGAFTLTTLAGLLLAAGLEVLRVLALPENLGLLVLLCVALVGLGLLVARRPRRRARLPRHSFLVHRPWGLFLLVALLGLTVVQPTLAGSVKLCRGTSVPWLRYQVTGLDPTGEGWGYVASGATWIHDTLVMDGLTEQEAIEWQVTLADGTPLLAGEAVVQLWDENGLVAEYVGRPEARACKTNLDPSGEHETLPPWEETVPEPEPDLGNGGLGQVVLPAPNPEGCYLWRLHDDGTTWDVAVVRADPYTGTVTLTRDGSGTHLDPAAYELIEVPC